MIGNDIVDLKLASMESNPLRPGFLEKIFSVLELRSLDNSTKLITDIWLYWAMKEAAYKAHQRRFSLLRRFNPQKFIVTGICPQTRDSGKVIVDGYQYYCQNVITKEFIHSTATGGDIAANFETIFCPPREIRSTLRERLAQVLSIKSRELCLEKDNNFVPQIIHRGLGLPIPFSLSHHGSYGAFSFQLMNY
ncbi:hypothetical protein BH23BAC2_BH23BAC2_11990 [soil metagenome]